MRWRRRMLRRQRRSSTPGAAGANNARRRRREALDMIVAGWVSQVKGSAALAALRVARDALSEDELVALRDEGDRLLAELRELNDTSVPSSKGYTFTLRPLDSKAVAESIARLLEEKRREALYLDVLRSTCPATFGVFLPELRETGDRGSVLVLGSDVAWYGQSNGRLPS